MSFDVLQDKIRAMKNPTVAGLDARIEYVPEYIRQAAFEEHGVNLKGAAEAIWQFNVGLIDALCDIVPAVKPQAAYYENLGWQGMEMLERTIAYAKSKGMFVIADIKRGDIGSTASAYAEGWLSGAKIEGQVFKSFDADCVTLTALYHTKKMDLPAIIRRMTANPADILSLPRGRMAIGSAADLVIFDPDEEWVIEPEKFASKGRNTPFGGKLVKGKVKYTIVKGNIIYQEK